MHKTFSFLIYSQITKNISIFNNLCKIGNIKFIHSCSAIIYRPKKVIKKRRDPSRAINGSIIIIFQVNESLPSIALHVNESREILWGKTKLEFQVDRKYLKLQSIGRVHVS